MQAAMHLMEMMSSVLVSGWMTAQGAEDMQNGQDNEEQDGQPDAVRGQRLRQDGKQFGHVLHLPDTGAYSSCIHGYCTAGKGSEPTKSARKWAA
jgi:hypothetical protein